MTDKARIAVVDDDRALTALIREALARKGWQVDAFDTAEELLATDVSTYGAIFLDLVLPGMWGSECVYRLREMGMKGRVVAVTGHGDEWDEEDLLDLGFDAVVLKPFEARQIVGMLEQVLADAPEGAGG